MLKNEVCAPTVRDMLELLHVVVFERDDNGK
jgi:hypothetical protein